MPALRHGQGPAALRGVVMALHWTAILAIIAFLVGALPAWLLALHAYAWAAVTLNWGLRGGPSPALKPPLRNAALFGHIALLLLYAVAASMALHGWPIARPLLIATIAAGALHGAFNMWRAGVLGDGAFRRMLPKFLH